MEQHRNRNANYHVVNGNIPYAYYVDHHFILHQHNINPIQTRTRETEATRSQYHTNVGRNQPRVRSTQHALSDYASIQDGHFILHEDISQANQHVPTRRDIRATQRQSNVKLERIIIQEGITDFEAMTCSICLVELSVGSKAIRLPSPCSHVYHEACIVKWLDRSSTCPLCRRSVS